MADLSKLRFNGTDYNVKDASAPARQLGNGYSKTGTLPISFTDTISEAIGKLENNIGSGGGGGVNTVYVGTAQYPPDSNGKVSLPAYPTSLPANGGTASNVSGTVEITHGGTGATSASSARSNLGLGSAATKSSTSYVTSGSSALVTSGAVYSALATRDSNIAKNTDALTEVVDSGAKNEFSCFYINAPNARGLTFTDNRDGSITITGNNNGAGDSIAAIRPFTSNEMSAMAGYILTGVPTNTSNVHMFIQKDGSPYNNVAEVEANETDVIESVNYSCTVFLMIPKNTQNVNVTVRPMICSEPKYTISPKYIFNGYKQPVKHAYITTIEAGGYVKLGKLVNVVIRCVVGSKCAAYTSLFTGLPFPASGLSAGANFVACASNQSVPIIVCANGTIQNGEVLPAMTQLLISATYICL